MTATTTYGDAVDDDVAIMVCRASTATCSGYMKYVENLTKETAKMLRRKAKLQGRDLSCEGPLDYRITDYIDRLVAEDEACPT